MNYWHIQMNKPQGRKDGGKIIQSIDILNLPEPIIGIGEWYYYQCTNFKNKISFGDVVLVREGKNTISLVRVNAYLFSNNFLNKSFERGYC